MPKVTVAEDEAVSPEVSLTVAAQEITSPRDALLLSKVRVEALPKEADVLSLVHWYAMLRLWLSASVATTAQVRLLSL